MEGADTRTDEELAALVQGNNQDAFGVLMDRYQPKLMRYGRRFLGTEDSIEDVVQEVFIKAYRNIMDFDTTRRWSPWIYRIAHNAFVNALRKKDRDPLVFLDLDAIVAHSADDTESAAEREEMRRVVERGIGKLSPAYREIIALYYLEELEYREIADVLHVPTGTVGVRLKRAREALKKHLEADPAHDSHLTP
ncbi:MAG: RNA polymerase sigma factor [Patescibacteria group bacterium]|nr:RNA polymerase sigma factor [Patescibacteria group bacterium]MDE1965674.1 RNA polymerase sigma factor [Patescibacteria group bacterium]